MWAIAGSRALAVALSSAMFASVSTEMCVEFVISRCLLPTSSTEVCHAGKIHFVSTVLTIEAAWLNNELVLGQYCPRAAPGKTQSPRKKVDPSGKRAFPDRKSTRLNSSHGYISYA